MRWLHVAFVQRNDRQRRGNDGDNNGNSTRHVGHDHRRQLYVRLQEQRRQRMSMVLSSSPNTQYLTRIYSTVERARVSRRNSAVRSGFGLAVGHRGAIRGEATREASIPHREDLWIQMRDAL